MTDELRAFLIAGEQAGSRYRFASLGRNSLGTAGSQLAHAAGESMEFMEHRDYQPGDDLRRMNWSAYGRTDRLVVKVFRQEVCPHFDLIVDGSRSMNLTGTRKLEAALGLSAALACAAENSGFNRRCSLTGRAVDPIINGSSSPRMWEGMNFNSEISPAEAFRNRPPMLRPHGVRVIVSDFLWLGDPLEIVNPLADRAAATVLVQVLAREDVDPGQSGNQRLIDSETGETLEVFVDATAQQRYRKNLERHQEEWRQAARRNGALFFTFVAEDICRDWDLSELVQTEVLTFS